MSSERSYIEEPIPVLAVALTREEMQALAGGHPSPELASGKGKLYAAMEVIDSKEPMTLREREERTLLGLKRVWLEAGAIRALHHRRQLDGCSARPVQQWKKIERHVAQARDVLAERLGVE